VFTTVADPDAVRAPDRVNRNFRADRPDALWVTDLTYVPTLSGMAYVCFIVDAYSRRIVGCRRRRRHTCAPTWSSTRSRWPAVHAATAD
jgi:transposase InsO family protein